MSFFHIVGFSKDEVEQTAFKNHAVPPAPHLGMLEYAINGRIKKINHFSDVLRSPSLFSKLF